MQALTLDNLKILDGIVKSVSINVMDDFRRFQRAPEINFHNMPMFKDSATIGKGNFPITITVDGPFSVKVTADNVRATESLEPLIMDVTKPLGFMGKIASIDSTRESGFAFSLAHSNVGISELSCSLEVCATHSPTSGVPFATFDRTFFGGHFMPPFSDDSLFFGISHFEKRRNGKHRVNSGEPKSRDMAIPSQARSTLLEGVETTGEVKTS